MPVVPPLNYVDKWHYPKVSYKELNHLWKNVRKYPASYNQGTRFCRALDSLDVVWRLVPTKCPSVYYSANFESDTVKDPLRQPFPWPVNLQEFEPGAEETIVWSLVDGDDAKAENMKLLVNVILAWQLGYALLIRTGERVFDSEVQPDDDPEPEP